MSDLYEDKNISPMLMYETEPFDDNNYIYELKLDGIRCIAYVENGAVVLHNKRHKDVSGIYPELAHIYRFTKEKCILDGEIITLKDGKPYFYGVQKRSLMTDRFKIEREARKNPVQFVAYDMLYLGKTDITAKPLMCRKELMQKNLKEGDNFAISRYVEGSGRAFFELVKAQDLEGIVAKKKDGAYYIGRRTREWVKIKAMQDEDLIIFGYRKGEDGGVKDLILGCFDGERAVCRGKVYLGVSARDRELVAEYAANNAVKEPWFGKYKDAVWLKAGLIGTVRYMQKTEGGHMRQPVFKGIRSDV